MNKPKKVLFVTRDRKPGMIATRIARILQAQSVEIRVIADGLSVAEWKGAGFDHCMVAEGPLDIKEPWDINPKDVFYNTKPDVVVCGLSSPMRSEAWFAAGAKNKKCSGGVPLVVLDDNWGSTFRCNHPADLVLTIDELGKQLVSQNPAYAHHDYKVEIIGDLSATAATEPIPQATIDAFNAAKGDADYAFILASQKWPESDDIIEVACKSCEMSLDAGAKLVVIPRFHPGAKPEDKERWSDTVDFILNGEYGEKYVGAVKSIPDTADTKHNTDHLAMLADGVFAATGSALRAAAYAGRVPFCVWTPRLGEKLKAESGMVCHPLALAHGAIEIGRPEDVADLIRSLGRTIHRDVAALITAVPFDAVKAANAILEIAK